MGRDDAMIALVMSECEDAVKHADGTEAKLRAAMNKAKGHWMVLDGETQFKGALGAVLKDLGDGHPDHERLLNEIKMIGKVNALMHAAHAGLNVSLADCFEGEDTENMKPFGITGMWKEIAGDRAFR